MPRDSESGIRSRMDIVTNVRDDNFRRTVNKSRRGDKVKRKKKQPTDLCNHWSRSCAVLQLKYLGPPVLGVTWKQCGLPRRLGCNGVTAARSIEVTACPHSRDSCERQPRRPAPRCFCRSSFVTLFVLFRGFDRNDRFEKKFCKIKASSCKITIQSARVFRRKFIAVTIKFFL